MKNKFPKSPKEKKRPGHETLIQKLERIDKKLDLFNVLNKTVPAMFVSTLAIVSFLIYARATVINTEGELPQTGEEVTSRFRILYPENNTTVTTPVEIISLSIDGFYQDTVNVAFYAQDDKGEISEIGEASKGGETGEYRLSWDDAQAGSYMIWAQITDPDSDTTLRSEAITVDIKTSDE